MNNVPNNLANFFILQKKNENQYRNINNDNNTFIIENKNKKILFTNVLELKKKFFYKDDVKTNDTLAFVLNKIKNITVMSRYSTLTQPLCHLVSFKLNNLDYYLFYEIPNIYLKNIELFDNISKTINTFIYNTNSLIPHNSYRYELINFFVKDNDLKSITIDNTVYNKPIITNRFFQHLSSVVVGKITIGEPLYIKSFFYNDDIAIDVFQEKRYNIIDATQKFIICKRIFKFDYNNLYNFSLFLEDQSNFATPKNLTEKNVDLSSIVLTKNQIETIARTTTSWPIYDCYKTYIQFLNNENDYFLNHSYEDLKLLFKSKNTIVFNKNISRRRKRFIKKKANLFYRAIISDNSEVNLKIMELMTQNTNYKHIPEDLTTIEYNIEFLKTVDNFLTFLQSADGMGTGDFTSNQKQIFERFLKILSGSPVEKSNKNLKLGAQGQKNTIQDNRTLRTKNYINWTKLFTQNVDSTSAQFSIVNETLLYDTQTNKVRTTVVIDRCIRNNPEFRLAFASLLKQGYSPQQIIQNCSKYLQKLHNNPRYTASTVQSNLRGIPTNIQQSLNLVEGTGTSNFDKKVERFSSTIYKDSINTNFYDELIENFNNPKTDNSGGQIEGGEEIDNEENNSEENDNVDNSEENDNVEENDNLDNTRENDNVDNSGGEAGGEGNDNVDNSGGEAGGEGNNNVDNSGGQEVNDNQIDNGGQNVDNNAQKPIVIDLNPGGIKLVAKKIDPFNTEFFIYRNNIYQDKNIKLSNEIFDDDSISFVPDSREAYNQSFDVDEAPNNLNDIDIKQADETILASKINDYYKPDKFNASVDKSNKLKNMNPGFTEFIKQASPPNEFVAYEDYTNTIETNRKVNINNTDYMFTTNGQETTYSKYSEADTNTREILDKYPDDLLDQLDKNTWNEKIGKFLRETYKDGIGQTLDEKANFIHTFTENNEFQKLDHEIIEKINLSSGPKVYEAIKIYKLIDSDLKIYYVDCDGENQFLAGGTTEESEIYKGSYDRGQIPTDIEKIIGAIESSNLEKENKNKIYNEIKTKYGKTELLNELITTSQFKNGDNRVKKIKEIIQMDNIPEIQKYVLAINGLYDPKNDLIDFIKLSDLELDQIDKLEEALTDAKFTENPTIGGELFTKSQGSEGSEGTYRNENNYRKLHNFITPQKPVLTSSSLPETIFGEFQLENLEKMVNQDTGLTNVFEKMDNLEKINDPLLNKTLYVDQTQKNFIGMFSDEGVQSLLSHAVFEETSGLEVETNENKLFIDNQAYRLDVEYDNLGRQIEKGETEARMVQETKMLILQTENNERTVIEADFKTGKTTIISKNDTGDIQKTQNITFDKQMYSRNTTSYTTNESLIIEVRIDDAKFYPRVSKMIYQFPISTSNDDVITGKPIVEIEIAMTEENIIKKSFEATDNIQYKQSQVLIYYPDYIKGIKEFTPTDSLGSSYIKEAEIESTYLSQIGNETTIGNDEATLRIPRNYFDTYPISDDINLQRIIDKINSELEADQYLTLDNVKNLNESDDYKEKMFLAEKRMRENNLKMLNRLYNIIDSNDYEQNLSLSLDQNYQLQELMLIGNEEQEELRQQYINSPNKTKDVYNELKGKHPAFKNLPDVAEIDYQEQYNDFSNEVTNKSIQDITSENLLDEPAFERFFAQQVYQNQNTLWNLNQKYFFAMNKTVCEFTPFLVNDGTTNRVVYQKNILNVDLDYELKDSNMNKRYVIYNSALDDWEEIYKAKDIRTGENCWKKLPRSVMENRDKLFLQESGKKPFFSSIGNQTDDNFQKHRDMGTNLTTTQELELWRSSFNRQYENELFTEIMDTIVNQEVTPEKVNGWNIFKDDSILSSPEQYLRKQFTRVYNYLANIVEFPGVEEGNKIRRIILGLEDEIIDVPSFYQKKINYIQSSFFSWFVKNEGYSKTKGENVVRDHVNRYSSMTLNEYKRSSAYQTIQIQKRNRNNLYSRRVTKAQYIDELVENITTKIVAEDSYDFQKKKEQIKTYFLFEEKIENLKIAKTFEDDYKEYRRLLGSLIGVVGLENEIGGESLKQPIQDLCVHYKLIVNPNAVSEFKIASATETPEGTSYKQDAKYKFGESQLVYTSTLNGDFNYTMLIVDSVMNEDSPNYGKIPVSDIENLVENVLKIDGKVGHEMSELLYKLKKGDYDNKSSVIYGTGRQEYVKTDPNVKENDMVDKFAKYGNGKGQVTSNMNKKYYGDALKDSNFNSIIDLDDTINGNEEVESIFNTQMEELKGNQLFGKTNDRIDFYLQFFTSSGVSKNRSNIKKLQNIKNKQRLGIYKNGKEYAKALDDFVKDNIQNKTNEDLLNEILNKSAENNSKKKLYRNLINKEISESDKNKLAELKKFLEDLGFKNGRRYYRYRNDRELIKILQLGQDETLFKEWYNNLDKKNEKNDAAFEKIKDDFIKEKKYIADNFDTPKLKNIIKDFNAEVEDKQTKYLGNQENKPKVKDAFNLYADDKYSEIKKDFTKFEDLLEEKTQINEISRSASNHETSFIQTLDNDDSLFKTSYGIEEGPDGKLKVASKEFIRQVPVTPEGGGDPVSLNIVQSDIQKFETDEKGQVVGLTYEDWLLAADTQKTIAENHGYIDPPYVNYEGGWSKYYNNQSKQFQQILDQDVVELQTFYWTEKNGRIEAQYIDKPNRYNKAYYTGKFNDVMDQITIALRKNKINAVNRLLRKHKKELRSREVAKKLPFGQPIKINNAYFIKVNGNSRISSTDSEVRTSSNHEYLVKITEQQVAEANRNSIKVGDLTSAAGRRNLRASLRENFSIDIDEKFLRLLEAKDFEIKKDSGIARINSFNVQKIAIKIEEVEKEIIDGKDTDLIPSEKTYLKTKTENLSQVLEEIKELNENQRILKYSQFNIPENLRAIIEEKISNITDTEKKRIIKLSEAYYKEEHKQVKQRTLKELSENKIRTLNNNALIKNFEESRKGKDIERAHIIRSRNRENLQKQMESLYERYAKNNFEEPNLSKVKKFFEDPAWYNPEGWSKEDLQKKWNDFKLNTGLTEIRDPPYPQDFVGDDLYYKWESVRQLYKWSTNKYVKGLGLLLGGGAVATMGAFSIVGFAGQFSDDLCDIEKFDEATGERVDASECEALSIARWIEICASLSNETDTFEYLVKLGDQYTKRHTTEGDELAQDPQLVCTPLDSEGNPTISNDRTLVSWNSCVNHQKCTKLTILDPTPPPINDDTISMGLSRLNMMVGEYTIDQVEGYTGLSLDALTRELGNKTVIAGLLLGISQEEYDSLQLIADEAFSFDDEYESVDINL